MLLEVALLLVMVQDRLVRQILVMVVMVVVRLLRVLLVVRVLSCSEGCQARFLRREQI